METQPAKSALIKKEIASAQGWVGRSFQECPPVVNLDLDNGQTDINGIKDC